MGVRQVTGEVSKMEPARNIVFVCLHGAAKSVIAAAYVQRLAESRGWNIRATSVGIDPEPEVPRPGR
jgi:arsenate reductase (thioredoxin)